MIKLAEFRQLFIVFYVLNEVVRAFTHPFRFTTDSICTQFLICLNQGNIK